MFVTEARITREWTPLSELCTVENDVQYMIVNTSIDKMYAVEGAEKPEDTVTGAPIPPNCYAVYKKGEQELYLRNGQKALTKDGEVKDTRTCLVTIHKVG